MTARKKLSKTARFEVFKRDLFTCQYCGRKPPAVVLEVDHVVAVAEGGGNGEHNLLTACFDCNRGKGAKGLEAAPIDVAERMALIEERAAQVRAYEELLQRERARADTDIERVMAVYSGRFEGWILLDSVRPSIRNFLAKLPPTRVVEAMEMACTRMTKDHAWRYFCGICWRWIKEEAPL